MIENSEFQRNPKINILTLFNADTYRTYNVNIARRLKSLPAAILLSELVGRQQYHESRGELISLPKCEGLWFYYLRETGIERLGLSISEQKTALEILIKHKLVEKTRYGLPCRNYYKISEEGLLDFLGYSNNFCRKPQDDIKAENNPGSYIKKAASRHQYGRQPPCSHIIEEPKEEPKLKKPTPTPNFPDVRSPEAKGQGAPSAVAIAPGGGEIFSSSITSKEQEAPPPDLPNPTPPAKEVILSPAAKEVSDAMIAALKKHSSVYREPKNMSKFNRAVRKMIDIDNQDPKTLLSVFEYAISDTEERGTFKGWSSVIYGKCPASQFLQFFVKIQKQMEAKPKAKFDRTPRNADGTKVQVEYKF